MFIELLVKKYKIWTKFKDQFKPVPFPSKHHLLQLEPGKTKAKKQMRSNSYPLTWDHIPP